MTRSVCRWGKCWVFMQIASWREREGSNTSICSVAWYRDNFRARFPKRVHDTRPEFVYGSVLHFFSLYAQGSPFTTLSFFPFPFAVGWSPRTLAEFLWQIGKTVGVKFSKTSTPFSIALPFRSLFRRSHEYCKFSFGFWKPRAITEKSFTFISVRLLPEANDRALHALTREKLMFDPNYQSMNFRPPNDHTKETPTIKEDHSRMRPSSFPIQGLDMYSRIGEGQLLENKFVGQEQKRRRKRSLAPDKFRAPQPPPRFITSVLSCAFPNPLPLVSLRSK